MPWILRNPCWQKTATCPCPETDYSGPLSQPFVKFNFNIILSLRHVLQVVYFLHFCLPKPCMHHCPLPCMLHAPPTPCSLIDHPNNICWGMQVSDYIQISFTSFLVDPSVVLWTLFSKILSLCYTLDVTGQFSHPRKTRCKIIIPCTNDLICTFIHCTRKVKYSRHTGSRNSPN